jgi:hypothetical protein
LLRFTPVYYEFITMTMSYVSTWLRRRRWEALPKINLPILLYSSRLGMQ